MKAGYKVLLFLASIVFLDAGQPNVAAAAYPDRTVHIICGYPAGGGLDLVMRALAKRLSEAWGQPVIIDNRPGAATTVGAAAAAKAPPDGYTILSADVSFSIGATLYKNAAYDPIKDFIPVSLVANVSNVFVVHPSVPAKSIQEFIAFAKKSPTKLRYASGGSGTLPNLAMVTFAGLAGIEMEQIPYRGSGGSMMSMVAGTQDAYIGALGSVAPFLQAGQLRPLAVLDKHRSKLFPDVPTIAEAGLPDFDMTSWYGLLVPAGTDRAIVDKIANDVRDALAKPDVQETIATLADEPVGDGPEAFAAFLKLDLQKWGQAVKAAGAVVE